MFVIKHLTWLKYNFKQVWQPKFTSSSKAQISLQYDCETWPNILVTSGELRLNQAERFWSFPSGHIQGRAELLFFFFFFITLGCCHTSATQPWAVTATRVYWLLNNSFLRCLFPPTPFFARVDDSFHFNLGSTPANIPLTRDQRAN